MKKQHKNSIYNWLIGGWNKFIKWISVIKEKDPMIIATIVIAITSVINLVASCNISSKTSEYTEITSKIYKASNRPYIGIDHVDVDSDENHLFFTIIYKNFGTVPANAAKINIYAIIDGIKCSVSGGNDIYNLHETLFPQVTRGIRYKHGVKYIEIMSGHAVFDLVMEIKYKGIAENDKEYYGDYEKWRLDPAHRAFFCIEAKTR